MASCMAGTRSSRRASSKKDAVSVENTDVLLLSTTDVASTDPAQQGGMAFTTEPEPLDLSPVIVPSLLDVDMAEAVDASSTDAESVSENIVVESDPEGDSDNLCDEETEEEEEEADSALVCGLYELLCNEHGTNVTEALLLLKESVDTQNKILYNMVKLLGHRLG